MGINILQQINESIIEREQFAQEEVIYPFEVMYCSWWPSVRKPSQVPVIRITREANRYDLTNLNGKVQANSILLKLRRFQAYKHSISFPL